MEAERATTAGTWLDAHDDLPRLERELLLGDHLGVGRASLLAHPERVLPGAVLTRLHAAAARLRAGEPFAYVTGEREFWSLPLEVTRDVLIPRPESETLVEVALERLQPGQRVLELGTGSGAISIALATSVAVEMTATDVSPDALAVAARNARRHAARVRFIEADWYSGLEDAWHLIVANPPYIAEGDPHLPALGHEPVRALVAGTTGLEALNRIIDGARARLEPGGWLLVEHGYDQAPDVRARFEANGFREVETVRDLGGQPRVTLGRPAGSAEARETGPSGAVRS